MRFYTSPITDPTARRMREQAIARRGDRRATAFYLVIAALVILATFYACWEQW